MRRSLSRLAASLAIAIAVSAQAATPRPEVDLSAAQPPAAATLARLDRLRADPALIRIGTVTRVDERYGVPNLVLAASGTSAAGNAARSASPADAARAHLTQLAPYYRLDAADVAGATLRYVHDTGEGGIIAAFDQSIDGVPVFREDVKVLLDRSLGLIAVSGHVPGREEAGTVEARAFASAPNEAVARALADMTGAPVDPHGIRNTGNADGGYQTFASSNPAAMPPGLGASAPIRARRVLFHLADRLVPAYYVELIAADAAIAYVVASDDGRVLLRHDLVAYDSFTYRVWADNTSLHAPLDGPQGNGPTPHPTGTPDLYDPPFVATSLVSLQNGPISTNDPWLAPGATTTSGNNVDAYIDQSAPDGFSAGDFRATTTSPNTFDRAYDPFQAPDVDATQAMASITQLFYLNNYLHDWFYDSGFNEAAGNGQVSNYGRGGVAGDPIHAETLDYSGSSNADMATPADGGSPRGQYYRWYPNGPQSLIQVAVNAPASIAGNKTCVAADTNPWRVNITAPIALPTPGTFSVALTTPLQVAPGAEWVHLADLDGDGRLDLASACYGDNTIRTLRNNGSGFDAPVILPTGAGPYMVITPDLNHDGKPDLVSANFTANNISVRLGTGGGTFGVKTDIPISTNPACVASGRFNADANDDIVVANWGAGTVSVLLGDGAGGFAPKVDYFTGANPNWVAVGDVNNDGKADLVFANSGSNTISVRLGLGTGAFDTRFDSVCGSGPLTLALGDLNGDGKLDAVTANSSANTVAVLLGSGNGFFGAPTPYAVPGAPVTVTLGHLNADGLLDVAVCSDAANSVSVLMGSGAGGLGAPTSFATGASPYGVQIGDFSGDGLSDLVTADFNGNSLSLLYGTPGPSLPVCPPFTNTLTGRIALVFGGTCSAYDKIHAAELAGAVAVIIADGTGTTPLTVSPAVGIPAFQISALDGNAMRTAMRGGGVSATLIDRTYVVRDAAIDNQITAHEWGHYLSNRLIGNANGLTNSQGRGMGEGWSDFISLLVTVKPEDAAAAANGNWAGAFSWAGYVGSNSAVPNNSYYFGIRRYPYSTDFAKGPLTFTHIQDGASLPAVPPRNSNGSPNSEVHNTGEVWCSALWECYASLLRATGRLTFTQARDRMRNYLVASLELTPVTPTFLEARDALLLAAYANDPLDGADFRAAFARRGMGSGADAPGRFADGNAGVIESFVVGGDLDFVSATLFDEIHSCDLDGYLDSGEDAVLTVRLLNPFSSTGNLSATTATVSSTNPNVTFPLGATMSFPASQPGGTTQGKVRVHDSGSGLQTQDFTIQYNDPGFALPGPRTASVVMWGNADEAALASDNVEERTPTWTFAGPKLSAASVPWSRLEISSVDHAFFVPGVDSISDQSLVSPSIAVGSGAFGFTFKHRYSFQGPYDGGVIEISTNGGGNWTDIGASVAPGYSGTIDPGYNNPLAGRQGFVGASPGYPLFVNATASLGTTYANTTVKIRFRFGSDWGGGSWPGWTIDNFVFTGITNQPFVTLVAEPGTCAPVAVEDRLPTELAFAIAGANPAPADPVVRFELPEPTRVRIDVYDVVGRRVATLADGEYAAGVHTAQWNTGSRGETGPGVYFARMVAGDRALGRRLVILAR